MTLLELIEKALGDAETAGESSISDATLAEYYEDRGAAAASKAALLAEVERLRAQNAQYQAVASEANVTMPTCVTVSRSAMVNLSKALGHPNPVDAAPGEAIDDALIRKAAWRKALSLAVSTAPAPTVDSDEPAYWMHEVRAFDRAYAQLEATAESTAESGGNRGPVGELLHHPV